MNKKLLAAGLAATGVGGYALGKNKGFKSGRRNGLERGIEIADRITKEHIYPVHGRDIYARRARMEKNAKLMSYAIMKERIANKAPSLLSKTYKDAVSGGASIANKIKSGATGLKKTAPGIYKVAEAEEGLLKRIANACELMARKEAKEAEREEKREKEEKAWKEIDETLRERREAKWRKADKMRNEGRKKAEEFEYNEEKSFNKIENAIRKKHGLDPRPGPMKPCSIEPCHR